MKNYIASFILVLITLIFCISPFLISYYYFGTKEIINPNPPNLFIHSYTYENFHYYDNLLKTNHINNNLYIIHGAIFHNSNIPNFFIGINYKF